MKRLFTIVAVFIGLIQITGLMPYYFYALDGIKHEVELKTANETQLQQLFVSENDYLNPAVFQKTEKGEFMLNGNMFDFRKCVKNETGYVFYVVADNKETNLRCFLSDIYSQSGHHGGNSKAPLSLSKNLIKDFFLNKTASSPFFVKVEFINHLNNNGYTISEGYDSIFFPPPNINS